MISVAKKLLEDFMKKNYKRLIKKNSGQKKYLKEKATNYMLNGKITIIRLIVGLIKKISIILSIAISLYKNESIFS